VFLEAIQILRDTLGGAQGGYVLVSPNDTWGGSLKEAQKVAGIICVASYSVFRELLKGGS